jgi:hypothetical protein
MDPSSTVEKYKVLSPILYAGFYFFQLSAMTHKSRYRGRGISSQRSLLTGRTTPLLPFALPPLFFESHTPSLLCKLHPPLHLCRGLRDSLNLIGTALPCISQPPCSLLRVLSPANTNAGFQFCQSVKVPHSLWSWSASLFHRLSEAILFRFNSPALVAATGLAT